MIIPVFQSVQFVDENGYLTSAMQMYNDELNNVLRAGLSGNGWTVPIVTQAELAEIQAYDIFDAMPDGTIWYVQEVPPNVVYNELVVKVNGALRKVTTTSYP